MNEDERQLRAIGFMRVPLSNEMTNRSIEYQKQQIIRRAEKENLDVISWYEDISRLENVLQEIYNFCEYDNDVSYILVADLQRISNHPLQVEFWISKFLELGVDVLWTEKSPIDKVIRNRDTSVKPMRVLRLRRGI